MKAAIDKQQPRGKKNQALWLAVVGVLVLLMLAFADHTTVDGLADADDHMRAAWLADSMDHGHFPPPALYHRTGGEAGMVVHWALLWNLVLIFVAAIPAKFVGWHKAFFLIAPYVETAVVIGAAFLAAWIVRPLRSRAAVFGAAAGALLAPAFVAYAIPVRLDHHSPVAALALLVAGLWSRLAATGNLRWALALAFAMPAALWVSADCLIPLTILCGLGMAITLRQPWAARLAAIIFPLAAAISYLIVQIDPPYQGATAIDLFRFSLLHDHFFVAMGVCLVLAAAAGTPFWRSGRYVRAVGLIGLGQLVAAALLVFQHPDLLAREATLIHFPTQMLLQINEYRGIDTPARAMLVLGPMAPAIAGAIWMAFRSGAGERRTIWALIALALAAMTLPATLHVRFSPYPHLLAAPMTGVAFWQATVAARRWRNAGGIARLAMLLPSIAVLPMVICYLPIFQWGETLSHAAAASSSAPCIVAPVASYLDEAFPEGTLVFGDLDISTRILSLTRLNTFAGPYHGYVEDMPQVYLDALNSTDVTDGGEAWRMLADRNVAAVVRCAGTSGTQLFVKPGTFGMALANGEVPAWLERVEIPVPASVTSIEVYRMRKYGGEGK